MARPLGVAGVAGFSLIEILLATALGVLMTASVVQLFVSNTRGYALQSGQARLQESARLALHFLAHSARTAGYLGCGAGGNLADGLGGSWRGDRIQDISSPVAAVDNVDDGDRMADWGLGSRRLKPGSDVVLFRRIDGLGHALAQPFDAASELVLASSFEPRGSALAVLSGCGRLGLLGIESIARRSGRVTPSPAVDVATLAPAGASYGGPAGPAGTVVAPMAGELYFVARSRFVNNRGERGWSLWRQAGRADELVSGVTDLQVLYGIDRNPDGPQTAPQRYVTADDIDGVVRAVRIAVTVSSVDAVTDDDQPLSRTVSQTVALRNRWVAM